VPPTEIRTGHRLARVLAVVAVAVVAVSLLTRWLAYRREIATPGIAPPWWLQYFDVNTEMNLPTWFAGGLLVVTGVVTLVVAGLHRPTHPRVARFLGLLGVGLLALSLDELTGLHERLGGVVDSGLHFTWVLPGLALAAVALVLLVRGLRAVSPADRRPFLLAAVLFFTGALVLETVSGQVLLAHGDRAGYLLVTAAEELLEMLGVVVALYAVLRLVRSSRDDAGWRLSPA